MTSSTLPCNAPSSEPTRRQVDRQGRSGSWDLACRWLLAALVGAMTSTAAAGGPNHRDVRYSDKYKRSVMDIWTASTREPAPVVVYFHGGGFKAGDKSRFRRDPMLRTYNRQGVAFASVNYPLLKDTENNYLAILQHTEKAIQHLIDHADTYNIDPMRISVMGSSAGALISGYLAHGAKLPICSVFARQQPMGTALLTIPFLRADGPPYFIYNTSSPKDSVHNPRNAQLIKKRCEQLNIACHVFGSRQSGLTELPRGAAIHDRVMTFFRASWKQPK